MEQGETLNSLGAGGNGTASSVRTRLRTAHREMLRRVFLGEPLTSVAVALGFSYESVKMIVRGPLFQAALAEMQREADSKTLDTASRLAIERQLVRAAADGVGIADGIMRNPQVHPATRMKTAFGFLDRVGYGPTRKIEKGGDGFRELIERLNDMERVVPDESASVVTTAEMRVSVRREPREVRDVTPPQGEPAQGANGSGATPPRSVADTIVDGLTWERSA